MALSDLVVFNEQAYSAMTEVLAQQVDLFNGASDGGMTLTVDAIAGDFSSETFFAAVAGLVRRRNPYGDGPIAEKVMAMKQDTIVKVAAGTPPVRLDKAWFDWIKMNPQVAGAAMGQQLAVQTMADMLDVAVGSVTAALLNTPALVNDISGSANPLPTPIALAQTAFKIGDRMGDIPAWFMHSKSWTDLFVDALSNTERLFSYGTVNVVRDGAGRRYIMADTPGLVVPANGGTPMKFHLLGLSAGGVQITQNDDYNDNWSETNGNENIKTTFQAEWSYNVGVKGFAWDKTNGGHAPNNAALFMGSNWDQIATSIKDGPGVLLVTQ